VKKVIMSSKGFGETISEDPKSTLNGTDNPVGKAIFLTYIKFFLFFAEIVLKYYN
jgi:hypothetical protein